MSKEEVKFSESECMEVAKELGGHPKKFTENQHILKYLVEQGIAAVHGKEGYARGHSWRQFVKPNG